MTNGEKLKEIFPSIELYEKSHNDLKIKFNSFWWNAEYKEPTTKNDLGVDCIKKSDAIDIIQDMHGLARADVISDAVNRIITMPSVTPQEPRKGHWIMTSDYLTTAYGSVDYVKCSCCGEDSLEEGDYCPNCGADMREVEE